MLRGPLGIILTPYGQIPGAYPSEIARTTGGGPFLCPFDPQYATRGSAGLYYDTQLGRARVPIAGAQLRGGLADIPNDFEIAKVRGTLTPNAGWVDTYAGAYNQPWVPPNGWSPTTPAQVKINYGSPTQQLGDATTDAVTAVVNELNEHHRRMFFLSAFSTAAVVVTSLISAIRTARLLKQESRRG